MEGEKLFARDGTPFFNGACNYVERLARDPYGCQITVKERCAMWWIAWRSDTRGFTSVSLAALANHLNVGIPHYALIVLDKLASRGLIEVAATGDDDIFLCCFCADGRPLEGRNLGISGDILSRQKERF